MTIEEAFAIARTLTNGYISLSEKLHYYPVGKVSERWCEIDLDGVRAEGSTWENALQTATGPNGWNRSLADYPIVPDYLHSPIVFIDPQTKPDRILLCAFWNRERWLFRVVNGAWVSTRRAEVEDYDSILNAKRLEVVRRA